MKKILKFYKTEDGRWWFDWSEYIERGGDPEDLEMVGNADKWLDHISHNTSEVFLNVSEAPFKESEALYLQTWDEFGAFYKITRYKGNFITEFSYVWLCSVTTLLFGYYPEIIYYSVID